ncbi:MAG: response regulator [Armatimonadota bacterium]|nr:MAG: response regulator [Armatimonadota bacterium]
MAEARKKILVVDDDQDDLRMISMILEPEGYEVVTAENGVEALAKVESETPDLVLLDVMMPELDGFAACAKLKSSPESQGIPVVLLTGVAKYITKSKYPLDGVLRADAEEYLEKPLDPEELLRVVAARLK